MADAMSKTIEFDVQALQKVPMFKEIDIKRLKLLAFTSERIVFSEGQRVFTQGDESHSAYLVLEGCADVLVNGPEGPCTVAKLGQYQMIGEMGLLTGNPRSATVIASVPMEVLRIDKEVFFELMRQCPETALIVMKELAQRLELSNDRLIALLSNG